MIHFLSNNLLKYLQTEVGIAKAAVCTEVAGGSFRFDLDEEGIPVAVERHFLHHLDVTACLSFFPESSLRAGIKPHHPFIKCLLVCVFIHEAVHQYTMGPVILQDDGKESAAFYKVRFHVSLTSNPSSCSLYFRSSMSTSRLWKMEAASPADTSVSWKSSMK